MRSGNLNGSDLPAALLQLAELPAALRRLADRLESAFELQAPDATPATDGGTTFVSPRLARFFVECVEQTPVERVDGHDAVALERVRRLFHDGYYTRAKYDSIARKFRAARRWAGKTGDVQTRLHEGVEYLIVARPGVRP